MASFRGLDQLCDSCKRLCHCKLLEYGEDAKWPSIYSSRVLIPVESKAGVIPSQAERNVREDSSTAVTLKAWALKLRLQQTMQISFHSTAAEIRRQAAARTCHLCFKVITWIHEHEQDWPLPKNDEADIISVVRFHLSFNPKYHTIEFCFLLPTEVDATSVQMSLARLWRPRLNLGSRLSNIFLGHVRKDTVKRLQHWFHRCSATHDDCSKLGACVLQGPTRLLEISETPNGLTVWLVENRNQKKNYASLSHCWGPRGLPAISKLTRGNYEGQKDPLLSNVLPKTFCDAIAITHLLGISYLWIDALCIIQDDEADWIQEAPQMHSIFSGSMVTLAATAARHSDDGLFIQENLQTACTLRLSLIGGGDGPEQWLVAPSQTHPSPSLNEASSWARQIGKSPLAERAWVMQELLLSRRIIHFTSSDLWWNCLEELDKEFHDFDDDQLYGRDPNYYRTMMLETATWWEIITSYSSKKLKFDSDRLVALSGIAERYAHIHNFRPSDYMLGCWKPELVRQLCWFSITGSPRSSYEDPSWSWISTPGRIGFVYESDAARTRWNDAFEFVSYECDRKGSSNFGPVTNVRLRIRALLLVVLHITSYSIQLQSGKGDNDSIASDVTLRSTLQSHERRDEAYKSELRPTHAIPMVRWVKETGYTHDTHWDYGLLLLRPVSGRQGAFIRADFWQTGRRFIDQETGDLLYGQRLPRGDSPIWWESGAEIESELVHKHLGRGRYEIELL